MLTEDQALRAWALPNLLPNVSSMAQAIATGVSGLQAPDVSEATLGVTAPYFSESLCC